LEWWPKLINRTDFNVENEGVRPTSPNMLGNIQVLFSFLGGGLIIAIVCLAVELLGTTLKYLKLGSVICCAQMRYGVKVLLLKPRVKFNADKVISINVQGLNMAP